LARKRKGIIGAEPVNSRNIAHTKRPLDAKNGKKMHGNNRNPHVVCGICGGSPPPTAVLVIASSR
jgi:hypothetical protein